MELRQYQKEVVENVIEAWQTCKNVMLQMPTGTGKTNVFCEIIRIHQNKYPGKKVIVLVHRRELVDQTVLRLLKFQIRPGQIAAGSIQYPSHHVHVAMVQTLIRRKEKIRFLKDVSLIIIDEAHHSAAATYRKLIEYYQSEQTYLLGVTATPRRSDGEGFQDIFQKLIQSWQIKKFIQAGFLADIEHLKTATYNDLKKDLKSIRIDKKTQDYDETELGNLMIGSNYMADAVESYIRYRKEFKRSIVFAVNVVHSKALTKRFQEKGIKAAHIDGTTDPQVRKNILIDFKNGLISVLCNVGIITEGFDCPDAEIVQLVRPTKSITLYLQQVGRVMRPKANGTHALVLDSARCFDEFGSVKADRRWKLDSVSGLPKQDHDGQSDSLMEAEAPYEDDKPMVKVEEVSPGPLTTNWFNNLSDDYKAYFRNRFEHIGSEDLEAILKAIWMTRQYNLSGLPFSTISALRDLRNIEILNISSTKCSFLRPIQTLNNLTSFYLSGTPVETLRLPDEKNRLKRLNLSRTKLSDISILEHYPQIEKLAINELTLTQKSYQSIGKLKCLRTVIAKNSNFDSLSVLHNSRNSLERLELNNSKLSSIATIHHYQNLKYLDISGTLVTSLDNIGACPFLETLIIRGLRIPKDEVRRLGNRSPVIWIED